MLGYWESRGWFHVQSREELYKENVRFAARSVEKSLALPYISKNELKAMSSENVIYRCKRKVDSNIPVTIPVRGLPPLGNCFIK